MNEDDFWGTLEMRVCAELAGDREWSRRGLWCDGFIPRQYRLDEDPPRIEGEVWIGLGERDQQEWEFILLLPARVDQRENVPWAELTPGDEMTRWLSLDLEAKHLQIEPGAAVPE